MCERLDCGKPATLVLFESPAELGEQRDWMVAYCDSHAGKVGHAAMMDSTGVRKIAPRGASRKNAAPAE